MTGEDKKYCKRTVTDADFIYVFDKFSEGVLVIDLVGINTDRNAPIFAKS